MGITVSPLPSGGGGSLPQLPIWTYKGGANPTINAGEFGFDNADPSASTHIFFSINSKNGPSIDLSTLLEELGYCYFVLTDASGKPYVGTIVSLYTSTVNYVELYFNWITNPPSLQGDYAFSLGPSPSLVTGVNGHNGPGAVTVNDADVMSASGINPIADGTYSVTGPNTIGSITFMDGRCTAYTPGT
ncbi:hypothetical protein CfE428DRAFT_4216 [Chthoniobacter flavus Ellin428]|uniref:Uncharacterized protein n=1 Tax=Chthoniobacter flavus Ellin428 TaxID=497964 RepID=B4D5M7_9BACT|nr:hypothetical protein [Chthoniobacter flavus]EDY18432.1 hypothetical protein CfE428DRAFT_4216 [Chthoniobacter flavus Ellin428]TCO90859.1 hypothetical protein EV701_1098 [Chthoniobacter flavus]